MEIGFNVVIETDNANVGLWTCWIGNSFKIFYPLEVEVPDEIIMNTLGVTLAEPVKNEKFSLQRWEKFYSERLEEGGRVWIGQEKSHSYAHELYTIENKELKKNRFGNCFSNTIYTSPSTYCNENMPDAPNANIESIMPYKDKFIKLFIEIAKLTGNIRAINIDSGLVYYTPDILEQKNYILERKRCTELIYYVNDSYNNCEIILKQGNSVVPWITILKFVEDNNLSAQKLLDLLDSLNNMENPINLVPFYAAVYKFQNTLCG